MLYIIEADTEAEAEVMTYDLWNESDDNYVGWKKDGIILYAYSYGGSSGISWEYYLDM
jgi:hypothetical protein